MSAMKKTSKRKCWAWLFLLLSGAASAAWVEVGEFDDGMRVYVDKGSARRTAGVAQVLHLVRWGEVQEDPGQPPYRSTVVRTAYDCSGKRERYLASISYSGAMGDGVRVAADDREAESWCSISEDSLEERLWRVACAGE